MEAMSTTASGAALAAASLPVQFGLIDESNDDVNTDNSSMRSDLALPSKATDVRAVIQDRCVAVNKEGDYDGADGDYPGDELHEEQNDHSEVVSEEDAGSLEFKRCLKSPKLYAQWLDKFYCDLGEKMNKTYNLGDVKHDMDACIAFAKKFKRDFSKREMETYNKALMKLACAHGYGRNYELWFGRIIPLIISIMGYAGLPYYRSLYNIAGPSDIRKHVKMAFDRCVKYMFERSATVDANGIRLPVVQPSAVHQLINEEPFVMSEKDKLLSCSLQEIYQQSAFDYKATIIKYVLFSAQNNDCNIVRDLESDKYYVTKYSRREGVHQKTEIESMALDLQIFIFKAILYNLTCCNVDSPLGTLFHLHDSLGPFINQEIPSELRIAELAGFEKDTSKEYLVFSNGTTYNCETAQFEKWHESQFCIHRAEINPSLALHDTIEHYTVEIHPIRGGRQYLHKILNNFIKHVHELCSTHYYARFAKHDMSLQGNFADKMWKRIKAMRITDDFERDRAEISSPGDPKFVAMYEDACMHYAVTSFIKDNPDVYNTIIEKMKLGDEELEDDGGPVVFVKHYISYEDKVWAIFDDLFGDRKRSLVVMKFLALAMRNGENGQHILFLHGEAADGKALFMDILAASLGGRKSKLVTCMHGEDITSRNDSTFKATLRDVSPDVRYLFVSEMPALDMDPRGVPMIKRLTGNKVKKAKIVATSSQLPYFKDSERAEITPFLILPMRSVFLNSIGSVRTNHLMHAVNQRAQNLIFGLKKPQFPVNFADQVEMDNRRANVVFEETELEALKTWLHTDTSILKPYKEPLVQHVPAVRFMYGDKNLLNDDVIERLGAALIRILTYKIIPEMGGLTNQAVQQCLEELDDFILATHKDLMTYKNLMLALIASKIVKVRDTKLFVKIEELRESLKNDEPVVKKTCIADMYGRFYTNSKNAPPESNVGRYLNSADAFERALVNLGFHVDTYRGSDSRAPIGTKVLYGYLMVDEYYSYMMKGREVLFDAITDDSHIEQYECLYDNVEDHDAFTWREFMQPVVGAPPDYGRGSHRPNAADINQSYSDILSAQIYTEDGSKRLHDDREEDVVDNEDVAVPARKKSRMN